MIALVFLAFEALGIVVFVGSPADTFVVDEAGVERLRFERSRRIAWSELACVSMPWGGGEGIRLESRRSRSWRSWQRRAWRCVGRQCGNACLAKRPGGSRRTPDGRSPAIQRQVVKRELRRPEPLREDDVLFDQGRERRFVSRRKPGEIPTLGANTEIAVSLGNRVTRRRAKHRPDTRRVRFGHLVDSDNQLNLRVPAIACHFGQQAMLGAARTLVLSQDAQGVGRVRHPAVWQTLHMFAESTEVVPTSRSELVAHAGP